MAIINTNGGFGTSDTVNSTNLNAVADGATFDDPVDEETLELITTGGDAGKLRVKAGGVDTTQIASNAVNFSKLTDVNDDDTMSNASAITLATSESIKAYIDKLKPNIVQDVKTDTFTDSNPDNVWDDLMTVTITPKFSNSKVMLSANISGSTDNNSYGPKYRFVKDGSVMSDAIGDADSTRTQATFSGGYGGQYAPFASSMDFLDNGSITEGVPVTYKVQVTTWSVIDVYINRAKTDSPSPLEATVRTISTFTAQEIYQ